MLFQDRALIDGPARITREGHLVATARVARANNVQDYMPAEIGMAPKADGQPYRIFRPEAAVFAKDAIASAAHRPITINHPAQDVTAANWKQLAVGDTGGEIMRDGDFLRIPVMVMDARGVEAAQRTHQEFSLGYSADIDMTPGKFGDAEYDGSMANIRINHLALCGTARGGAELRIVDERPAHLRDHQEPKSMKITIGDAKDVDLSDGAAVALAVGALNTTLTDAQTKVGTLTADLATAKTTIEARDGTIFALTQQVKDAEVTPAKLQQLADARSLVIGKAKALHPTIVVDGKTDVEIRKEAVMAKLGDAAKDMADAAIEGAFVAFTNDVKVGDARNTVVPIGAPVVIGDAATEYANDRNKQRRAIGDAWRTPFNPADAAA